MRTSAPAGATYVARIDATNQITDCVTPPPDLELSAAKEPSIALLRPGVANHGVQYNVTIKVDAP